MLFFHFSGTAHDLYLPLEYLVVFFENLGAEDRLMVVAVVVVVSQRIHPVANVLAILLAMAIHCVAQH